jgi:hypothetical protein
MGNICEKSIKVGINLEQKPETTLIGRNNSKTFIARKKQQQKKKTLLAQLEVTE